MSSRRQSSHEPDSRASSKSSGGHSTRPSPPPRLPSAPATYTSDDLDYLEERNERYVTQQHLVYALDHVVQVMVARGIPYAVMGGVSMIFLGHQRRTTSDVDVAVETKARELLAASSTDDW